MCAPLVCQVIDAALAPLLCQALLPGSGGGSPFHTVLWVGGVPAAAAAELQSGHGVASFDLEAVMAGEATGHMFTLRDMPERCAEDAYQLYFTSGTTGRPKAVVLTHQVRKLAPAWRDAAQQLSVCTA